MEPETVFLSSSQVLLMVWRLGQTLSGKSLEHTEAPGALLKGQEHTRPHWRSEHTQVASRHPTPLSQLGGHSLGLYAALRGFQEKGAGHLQN